MSISSQRYRRPEPETVSLSLLNALEYCPRRFYYEFVQSEMLVNEFVIEGMHLHQRVDTPGKHETAEGELRIQRLYLYSETLRLAGFIDVLEEENGLLVPVEYKHGKEGRWLNDHVQLCAQAMCLEERRPEQPSLSHGYIFYFGSRRRVRVPFTPELRDHTRKTIELALQLAVCETPPPPLDGKTALRCRDCSLRPLCLPDEVRHLTNCTPRL